ncbi:MAG: hypothetical protein K2N87_04010 [Eubacterium sp.]|nr:hypothetical protein [Eubacterium sp.]
MQLDKTKIYSTLGERSRDCDGQALLESTQEVYDFDEITKEIADKFRGSKPVASCDALYIKDEAHIYLIEFKNARKSRIGKKFFLQKAYDSAWTFAFAFCKDLSLEKLRESLYLIIVYNDEGVSDKEQESEHFQKFKMEMRHLARTKRMILFGLEKYEGVLYKEVVTVDKREFLEHVYRKIFT